MAGKTLVNGTAYDIKGGKTLINGTAYDIKGGKTLISGTAYDISVGKSTITLNVVNTNNALNSNSCYYIINSTKYTVAGSREIAYTDTLKIYVSGSSSSYNSKCFVRLNGVKVQSGAGTYTVNLDGCKTIKLDFSPIIYGTNYAKVCDITTT